MEIKGKIIEVLGTRSGTTYRGDWMSASYLFETSESYPKKFTFDVFGKDRIERLNVEALMSGKSEVVVYFDIEARQGKNGAWFNSVRAWDVRPVTEKPLDESATAENPNDLPFGR